MHKRDTYFQHLQQTAVHSLSHLLLVLRLTVKCPEDLKRQLRKKTKRERPINLYQKTANLSRKQGNIKLSTSELASTLHPPRFLHSQQRDGAYCWWGQAPTWLVESKSCSFWETNWRPSQQSHPCATRIKAPVPSTSAQVFITESPPFPATPN